jgi:IS1 family transposase
MKIVSMKNVSFDESKNKVHRLIVWSYAYQQARIGQWECAARDRSRFQRNIETVSVVLTAVLESDYRLRVYQERFQDFNDVLL